jgi:uncharacterized protein involved in exopolysaccharide biosynthesis
MADTEQNKTLRDLGQVCFRYKNVFAFSASIFAVVVFLGAWFLPIEYSASTKFERRLGEALAEQGLSGVAGTDSFQTVKQTQVEDLSGPELVETTLKELAAKDPSLDAFRELQGLSARNAEIRKNAILSGIRKKLDIVWEVKSDKVDVVQVTFRDANSELSWQFPNALVRTYIQQVKKTNLEQLERSRDFLRSKTDVFDNDLKDLENRRIDLETRHPGVTAEQHSQIVWTEQRIAADAEAIRRLLAISKGKVASIQSAKNAAPSTKPEDVTKAPNPEKERLGAELRKYKEEMDLALTVRCMTKDHPAVQTLQERINIMEKRIRETPDEIDLPSVSHAGGGGEYYTAMLAAAQAEVEILSSEMDRVQTQVDGYAKMNKDLEVARKDYVTILATTEIIHTQAKSWQDRLRQVEMALAAEKEGLRVLFNTDAIQWARRPQMPSMPRLPIVAGMALGGAMIFGALMIFAFHRKDRSLTSGELTESYLGVPVYGIISESLTLGQRASGKLFRWSFLLFMLAMMGVSAGGLVLRLYRPQVPDFLKPLQGMIYSVTESTSQPETPPTTQRAALPMPLPTMQPIMQPATLPATRPIMQPATQATTQPATQPETRSIMPAATQSSIPNPQSAIPAGRIP